MTPDFPDDVRRDVYVQLAHHLRLDKPTVQKERHDDEEVRPVRMALRHRDERGHESDITEWEESEIYGKGVSLDSLVRSIELSSCRDAAFQFGGDVIYAVCFHTKHTRNKSRFMFKVPGGQEVQHLAQSQALRGGSSGESASLERVFPDLLKYIDAKEDRILKKETMLWDMMTKALSSRDKVISEVTDREMRIREIELNADDHEYERQKKRREDEASEQMKKEGWELIKEHAPKALPIVMKALGRKGFSGNESAESSEWWAGLQQKKNGVNGHAKTEAKEDAPQEESQESEEQLSEEPSRRQQLELRIAFDTVRFVALVRGRKQWDGFLEALGEDAKTIFVEVATACDEGDPSEPRSAANITNIALVFGGAVQANPEIGFKIFQALEDGVCKLAIAELAKLLELYSQEFG
jgi:hypothetical protein